MPEDLQVYGDADKLARYLIILFEMLLLIVIHLPLLLSRTEIFRWSKSFLSKSGKTIPLERRTQSISEIFPELMKHMLDSAGAGHGLAIAKKLWSFTWKDICCK